MTLTVLFSGGAGVSVAMTVRPAPLPMTTSSSESIAWFAAGAVPVAASPFSSVRAAASCAGVSSDRTPKASGSVPPLARKALLVVVVLEVVLVWQV